MVTLQEQFEKDFPNKGVSEINILSKYKKAKFTNWDLDLREYKNLTTLDCSDNQLTSLPTLPVSLTFLSCFSNLIHLPISKYLVSLLI